jgi:sulfofructose kinase
MQVDVLCIGHACYDVSMFVDGYPQENSKCETHESLEACGGPAANAAYLLSSWGMRCAFAGLVGDDVHGRRIRQEFQSVGTDVSLLELREGHATPLSLILINKRDGSRTIVNRKARSSTFQCRDLEVRIAPRILLFDGHEYEASLASLAAFPDALSILDAGSWRDGTVDLAGKVHYVAASERFALQATNLADLRSDESRRECLARLREKFNPTTIVTLGENGLIFDDGGGIEYMAAFPVETVDTTAAGDIWHGAFAFGIAEATPLREALRFASMAAALSVQAQGGRASIPTLHRVKEALAHAG